MVLGSPSAQNMTIDNNEIIVRDNGNTSVLSLQFDGGAVRVGNSNSKLNVNTTGSNNVAMMIVPAAGDDFAIRADGQCIKSGGSSWAVLSDARLKNVLGGVTYGLDALNKINPVCFRYRDDVEGMHLDSKTDNFGFVAQEVQAVIPEAVTESADGYMVLNQDLIHLATFNGVKELDAIVKDQAAEITALKEELAALKALVTAHLRAQ